MKKKKNKLHKNIVAVVFFVVLYLISMASILYYKSQNYVEAIVVSDMPSKRTEVKGVVHEDKIYAIGGWEPIHGDSNLVEVYDPETDLWKRIEPLPRALHHLDAVSLNGKIYVVGGFYTEGKGFKEVADLYEFDGNRWKKLAPMPTARAGLGVVVYDGKIFAIGGHANGRDLAITEVYDPKTNTWDRVRSMKVPRGHLAVEELDGMIYVIGGRGADTCYFDISACTSYQDYNVVEVYNTVTNEWKQLDSPLIARSGLGTTAIGEYVYLFGGEAVPPNSAFSALERYDPKMNAVRILKTNATPRHNIEMVSYDGHLYTIGGGITSPFDAINLTEKLILK